MLARVLSGAVLGIDAYLVRVEADVANGLPNFSTVGLPQGAVKEGKDRVVAAIKNSGFTVPAKRITINLAPADVRKEGTAFDLPIAIGILASTGQASEYRLARYALLGELGLDGTLRPVRGALPVAIGVRDAGLLGLVVPIDNLGEAAVVDGVEVLGARTLREVVGFLDGKRSLQRSPKSRALERSGSVSAGPDLAEVRGQEHAKRALEVAAAGAHNILMIGPPGSGKTMLARRIPGILPDMTLEEALETTKIHSVAGLLSRDVPLVTTRPFRAPHHTVSDAGLIGGGSNPRPGDVSLAHNGVLFLDELPEFRRHVLESLRQPVEDRQVTISRAGSSLTYPAGFMLAAAMNPCPCGFNGDIRRPCTCAPQVVQRYLGRVSGPLLDRIDLHIELGAVDQDRMTGGVEGEASAVVRERIAEARERQRRRFAATSGVHANAHMTPREMRDHCRVESKGEALMRTAIGRLGLSARAYHRVLKIARTIADLEGDDRLAAAHVAEAIHYRSLDRTHRASIGAAD